MSDFPSRYEVSSGEVIVDLDDVDNFVGPIAEQFVLKVNEGGGSCDVVYDYEKVASLVAKATAHVIEAFLKDHTIKVDKGS